MQQAWSSVLFRHFPGNDGKVMKLIGTEIYPLSQDMCSWYLGEGGAHMHMYTCTQGQGKWEG